MSTYEYKILEVPVKGWFGGRVDTQTLTDKLNDLGKQGWEVITASDTNMYQGGSRNLFVILKREINR